MHTEARGKKQVIFFLLTLKSTRFVHIFCKGEPSLQNLICACKGQVWSSSRFLPALSVLARHRELGAHTIHGAWVTLGNPQPAEEGGWETEAPTAPFSTLTVLPPTRSSSLCILCAMKFCSVNHRRFRWSSSFQKLSVRVESTISQLLFKEPFLNSIMGDPRPVLWILQPWLLLSSLIYPTCQPNPIGGIDSNGKAN